MKKPTLQNILALFSCLLLFTFSVKGQNTQPDIVPNKTVGCAPEALTFTVANAPANRTFLWIIGKDTIRNGSASQSYLFTNSGSYDVEVFLFDNGKVAEHVKKTTLVKLGKPDENISLSTSRTILCNGADTVTFRASAKGVQKWDWIIDGTNYTNSGPSVTHRFTSPGYKSIIIRTRDSFGCYALKTFDSVVVVKSPPSVDFTANILQGCAPLQVEFTPQVKAGSSPIVSYKWSLPGSTRDNTGSTSSFTAVYDSAGAYDAVLEVVTQDGCVFTAVKKAYIIPGSSVSPSFSTTEDNNCSKSVFTFTNTSKKVAGQDFTWTFPGGTILPGSNDSVQYVRYNQSGTYDVTLSARSGNCYRTFSRQVSATVTAVIADFYSDLDCGCRVPDTITFIPVVDTTIKNKLLYQWTFINSEGQTMGTSSAMSPAIVFKAYGQYDVALKVTMPNGCTDSIYKQAAIRLQPIDTTGMTIETSVGCEGEEFTFVAPPVSLCKDEPVAYEWTYYDKDTNTVLAKQIGKESKMHYAESGSYGLSLKIRTKNGCEIERKVSNAATVVEPEAHFVMDSVYGCLEGTVTLQHKVNHPALKFNYQWTLTHSEDTTVKLTGTGETYRPVFSKPGMYNIDYKAEYEGSCGNKFIQKGRLFVSGVTGNFTAEKVSGCVPFTTSLKSSIAENLHYNSTDPTVRYEWSANPANNVIFSDKNAANPEITISEYGCYTITLRMINSVGCATVINKENYICIGVQAGFDLPSSMCSGSSVRPVTHSFYVAAYRWSVSPNAIISNPAAENPVITFPAPGTYRVTLVGMSRDNCVDSQTRTIIVEKPEAMFTSADTINYCAPSYVAFTASGRGVDSFYWFFGDGETLVTSDTSIAHVYKHNSGDMSTGYDVMLVVKSNLGCTDTIIRKKYIKVLGPIPAFEMSNNTGCDPLKVEFTDKSRFTNRWYLDYGDKSRIDTLVFGPQVYRIRDEDAEFSVYKPRLLAKGIYGCTAWADEKDSVVVYRLPKAGFTVSSETGCWPYKVRFTDTSKLSYQQYWDFNNDGKIDATGKNPEAILDPGMYSVKLVVENRFGCRDSVVYQNLVTVYPNIKAEIKSVDTACINTGAHFSISTDNDNLVSGYRWTIDGKLHGDGASNKSLTHVFSSPGWHRIEAFVTSITGCEQAISKDILVPDTNEIVPHIRYVTVDDDSSIRVVWSKPSSGFLSAYTLTRMSPAIAVYQGRDVNRTQFSDAHVQVGRRSYTYGLQNMDICGRVSGMDKHSSVWLTVKPEGKNKLAINWTSYKGWGSVKGYRLYRADEKGNFDLIAEFGGTDTAYTDEHLCDKVYAYVVEALHPADSYFSRSNVSSARPAYEIYKEGENVVVATVQDDEKIRVAWTNSYSHTSRYIIDRYTPGRGWHPNYAMVSEGTEFVDANVDVYETSYSYRVHLVNECGDLSEAGTHGKSILLRSKVKSEKVFLSWNRYDYWSAGVSSYRVELLLSDGSWKLLQIVPGSDTTYIDEEMHPEVTGIYTYRVTAVESAHNPQLSQSNRAKAILPSHIYVPNVFTPNADRTNDVFAPKTFSIYEKGPNGENNYEFSIYNRWGERVFETYKLGEGWDGTFKGGEVQEGTYIYIINAMGYDGQFYYLKGSVTLMK
jgi:gliding motility-associated-like protein